MRYRICLLLATAVSCHPLVQLSAMVGRSQHIWSDELDKREKAEAAIRAVIRLLKRRAKGSEALFTVASSADIDRVKAVL